MNLSLVSGLLAALAACPNDHVFRLFPSCATKEAAVDVPIEPSKATDILVVVDSSGSMFEEQQNLAENFFDPACPITDLANIPEQYQNPTPDVVQNELAPNCGFIQILAAYDVDWRVGVITTDVSACDNDFLTAGGNWGRRPQRGCLQVPPGETWDDDLGRKYIARGDEDVGNRFTNILNGIQIYGNNIERGLDAVEMFLTGAPKAPATGCEDDASSFVRDDARLVVIFLSDENDCSHESVQVGNTTDDLIEIKATILDGNFPDENIGESCQEAQTDFPIWYQAFDAAFVADLQTAAGLGPERNSLGAGALCYLSTHADKLVDVSHYVDVLKAEKGEDVAVAVIGGAVFDDNGGVNAGGCRQAGNGQPQGGCWESWGLSNSMICQNGSPVAGLSCCQADAGSRYFQLAQQMGAGNALTDSICYASFRQTMVDIAAFAARVGFVQLPEAPLSPAAVQVELVFKEACPFEALREPEDDPNTNVCRVPRIPDSVADPTTEDGWQLQGDTVRFYGTWVPQPGQEIRVRSLAASDTDVPGCTVFENTPDAGN